MKCFRKGARDAVEYQVRGVHVIVPLGLVIVVPRFSSLSLRLREKLN